MSKALCACLCLLAVLFPPHVDTTLLTAQLGQPVAYAGVGAVGYVIIVAGGNVAPVSNISGPDPTTTINIIDTSSTEPLVNSSALFLATRRYGIASAVAGNQVNLSSHMSRTHCQSFKSQGCLCPLPLRFLSWGVEWLQTLFTTPRSID